MYIYKDFLKNYLSEKRINHSVSTAKLMKKCSEVFKIDPEKAFISGLLHDVARELSDDEIIKLTKKFIKRKICKINYLKLKLNHPSLLHGAASAELMISKLKIKDEDILISACRHTLGGKNLSDLSKLTFISDYCEPLRNNPASRKVLKILVKERNLNKACFYTYHFLIEYLLKKNKIICPESIDGYNEVIISN
ncbi:MAG: bis(5'-nucleosyl)-tetraphosphatase (symmetrical) YqeK [Spirochaetes bacterium]|nr:bis(5'-nucleosyl)-tetraphosphatase (symmetrical) YqeK [Spirochaetota bacterium]